MGQTSDILILAAAGVGAGAFVLFTEQGKNMFEDLTGIQVPDIFDFDFDNNNDNENSLLEDEGGVERHVERQRYENNWGDRRRGLGGGLHQNYYSPDYYYPIQDLFVPPNYYKKTKYQSDPYRVPSPEFADWYTKGSGLRWEDYYFPSHYYWNPDYYYYFGNQYRMWYPNVYDISSVPTRRVPYWFGEVYY